MHSLNGLGQARFWAFLHLLNPCPIINGPKLHIQARPKAGWLGIGLELALLMNKCSLQMG